MHCERQVAEQYNKQLSLIKVFMYLVNNVECICNSPVKLKEHLAKYCCYEKRKKRLNMTELITNFLKLA
jgi:hypothetical protein